MKNPKVNYEEYELANGECVAMSTAPILMLTLRKKDKKAYETLSKVLVKGSRRELHGHRQEERRQFHAARRVPLRSPYGQVRPAAPRRDQVPGRQVQGIHAREPEHRRHPDQGAGCRAGR